MDKKRLDTRQENSQVSGHFLFFDFRFLLIPYRLKRKLIRNYEGRSRSVRV